MNGLRSKLTSLKESIISSIYEIIILTETNLSSEILTSELGLSNYNIFRKDRSNETSAKMSGGGVLVAVHNSHLSSMVTSSVTNVESVFVSASIYGEPTLIGGVYIPPQSPSQIVASFCDSVEEIYATCEPNTKIVIAGDFNQPDTDWTGSPRVAPNSASAVHIWNLANYINVFQINSVLNTRGVLLDLVFASDPGICVVAASDPLLAQEPFHPALEFTIPLVCSQVPNQDVFIHDFRRCNVAEVRRWIESLQYPDPRSQTVEESFSQFCLELGRCICTNSPLMRKSRSNFPHWFSRDLKSLIFHKKILHKKFKKSMSDVDYHAFKTARSHCKDLTRACHNNYMRSIDLGVKENPKSFWGHMKTLCKANPIPGRLHFDGVSVDKPMLMSELFSDYFSTVYAPPSSNPTEYEYQTNVNISTLHVSALEVEEKLLRLDCNKGAGPDNITPAILKACSSVIAPHLSTYFNQLMKKGIFPDVLKPGFLVPVHKSGDACDVKNYRPIVIQSVVAKVFESLVLDVLSFAFKNVIIPEQHGFRVGRSIVTNLCVFTNYVYSAFSQYHQVDCIYLDFAKAFDRVSHDHLISKLKALGVSGPLLQWFRSYLTGRTLRVRFAAHVSDSVVYVTSGVPQGSLLGPFLFSLFINDIAVYLNCKFLLFADDVKIFLEVSSVNDQLTLQMNLDRINVWCHENDLHLNAAKCQVMTFGRTKLLQSFDYHLYGTQLKRVHVIKDLGLCFTPNMDPGEHIAKACAKANRVLGLVTRASRGAFTPGTIKILYMSLVRPILEYGSTIWSPYQIGHCNSLNAVQKKFLRLMGVRSGLDYHNVDINEIARQHGVSSLSSRRSVIDLVFLFKLINGQVDCPDLLLMIDFHTPHRTRSTQLFAKNLQLTAYAYHSTIPRLMRLGNASQLEFFGPSLQNFKRQAHNFVSSLLEY